MAVAGIVTAIANTLRIAALQHGSTIELARGFVVIDDACGGIRSLQAGIKASLFLGEYLALRTAGRIALVVAGAIIAFIANCARVLALILLVHRLGPDAIARWHDPVGGAAAFFTFALLLAVAILFPRRPADVPPPAPPFLLTIKIRDGALPCAVFPFKRDGVRILALQSLSAGGSPESRLVDPAQIPGGIRRLATLWQEPMRQITEELLLYIPDPGEAEARKNSAADFLNAILSQRKP